MRGDTVRAKSGHSAELLEVTPDSALPRNVVDPRRRLKKIWDAVVVCAAMYTASVLPCVSQPSWRLPDSSMLSARGLPTSLRKGGHNSETQLTTPHS